MRRSLRVWPGVVRSPTSENLTRWPFGTNLPGSVDGTTPLGVGDVIWPGPGVVLGSAQPRAAWHNAVGVGEGNREWTRMDANGWGRGLCDLGEKSEWEQNLAQSGGGAERSDLGSLRLGVSAGCIFRWGLCCERVLTECPCPRAGWSILSSAQKVRTGPMPPGELPRKG